MLNRTTKNGLLLLALWAANSMTSHAQDQPGSKESAPSSVWVSKCTSAGRAETPDCTVELTVTLTKTQQFLLSIVVRVPPQERQPGMMIHLPLGLFIPAGVTTQLDSQRPEKLQVQTCDSKGCYAGTAVSSKMLAAMEKGKRLTITFEDLRKDKITVPVPLEGFAEAYRKIR